MTIAFSDHAGTSTEFRQMPNQFSGPDHLKTRADAATALAHAIAACDRDDACQLMTAALCDLSGGGPDPVFLDALDDATWWAGLATPGELSAFLEATLEALCGKALHSQVRKRLFIALWRSFGPPDQKRFLAWVTGGGKV